MLKCLINSTQFRKNRLISREELTQQVLAELERREQQVAELRVKALAAYANDHEGEIAQYAGFWQSCRIGVGEYKAKLRALQNPEVKGRFSYERMIRRYAKQNLVELPLDFEMEQAKRTHEQRIEEAEQWIDDRFSCDERMDRFLSGRKYAGCPVGNFEAVEQYYQSLKN